MAAVFKKGAKGKEAVEKSKAKPTEPSQVIIDHPTERELVNLGHYAMRIASDYGSHVQVSVNKGDWHSCRFSVGFFWFDWHFGKGGTYKILARSQFGNGPWKTSEERSCVVIEPKKKK